MRKHICSSNIPLSKNKYAYRLIIDLILWRTLNILENGESNH